MTLQPASGARDLNPQQVRKNHLIASKLSSLYQLWGYERISPPHIERLDTLMAASGISNNEILKIVSDEPDGSQVSSLMYAALILMILTLMVNVFAQWIVKKLSLKY